MYTIGRVTAGKIQGGGVSGGETGLLRARGVGRPAMAHK